MKKVNLTSSNLTEEKLAELYRILPEAFAENKIDFDKLRTVLGDSIVQGSDKFSFSWAGKGGAIRNVLVPSRLTLNPEPTQSIKWDESENLFIEGDNLEVLKLLQKAYFEKVKMIYIDPPYNTGHDFVYNDDFSAPLDNYLKQTGQKTGEGESTTTNKETNGRYHSDWLSMMYPRLKLAWNLLRDDGVIFVSIDDDELHHLKMVMNEVFGEENFIAQFVHKNNSSKNQAKLVSVSTEYFLCYSRNLALLRGSKEWRIEKKGAQDIARLFEKLKKEGVSLTDIDTQVKQMYQRPKYAHLSRWNKVDENGVFKDADLSREGGSKEYTIKNPQTGVDCVIPERGWGKSLEELKRLQSEDLIWYGDNNTPPGLKDYITSEDLSVPDSFWYFDNSVDTRWIKENFGSLVFENPKPVEMIRQIVQMAVEKDENGIILDFFAGSGTTAHAVMAQNAEDGGNRNWICVQLPELTAEKSAAYKAGYKNIAGISKARIKKVAESTGGGFKLLKLSESNYPENNFILDPEKSPEENQKEFVAYLERAKQGKLFNESNDMSLVYENIVKEGLSLNSKVAKVSLGKNTAYQVTDGAQQLLVCLEKKLFPETVKILTDTAYKGRIFICLEESLSDTIAANLSLNLDLKTI